jgi:hypothetical protein
MRTLAALATLTLASATFACGMNDDGPGFPAGAPPQASLPATSAPVPPPAVDGGEPTADAGALDDGGGPTGDGSFPGLDAGPPPGADAGPPPGADAGPPLGFDADL